MAVDLRHPAVETRDEGAILDVLHSAITSQIVGMEQTTVAEVGVAVALLLAGRREPDRRHVQDPAQDVISVAAVARTWTAEWIRIVPLGRTATPGAHECSGRGAR